MKSLFLVLLLTFAIGLTTVFLLKQESKAYVSPLSSAKVTQAPLSPTPTVSLEFGNYTAPKIEKKREYSIVMIGDSMTHALGPHGGKFYEDINALYKDSGHGIVIDNYSGPSTNILTIDQAMNKQVTYWDSTFEPLLSRQFDLILVESFAYNPLSQFGLEGGIKRQNEELDKLMKLLIEKRPNAVIMFVSTIAPSRSMYSGTIDPNTSASQKVELADERIAYLKNHIEYAKSHNIPIINIYEKSLTPAGDGNLDYINPDDYIHPSAVGLEFIGKELADFIYQSNVFPK